MTTPSTIDIPALLALAADLEIGHPIESVLRAHGIPERTSAYEVVSLYHHKLRLAAGSSEEYSRGFEIIAETLRPCVEAIAEWFAEQVK